MATHDGIQPDQAMNPIKEAVSLPDDNFQYNKQDMDQEQRVDVNPVLTNRQNIHFHLAGDAGSFSGKITGSAYSEKKQTLAANAAVLLYLGNDKDRPVYRGSCDGNGNFEINALPAGFYTIAIEYGAGHIHRTQYVKVLPCQTVHQEIILPNCYISSHC